MLFEHKFLYRRIKSVLPEGDARRPARRGAGDAAGQAPDADRLRRLDLDLHGGGGRAGEVGGRGRGDRSADAGPLRRGDGARLGASGRAARWSSTRRQLTDGFGAEVAARLADAAFPWLDAPIRRVTYPDRPVPYARNLEKVLLPDKGKVLTEARELLAF